MTTPIRRVHLHQDDTHTAQEVRKAERIFWVLVIAGMMVAAGLGAAIGILLLGK